MSFWPDRTGQVLLDWTESGLIFSNILHTNSLKIRSLETNLVSTALLDQIDKQTNKQTKNVQFPDSPDLENFPDYWTGRDVQ
jgi:hypothetical protein